MNSVIAQTLATYKQQTFGTQATETQKDEQMVNNTTTQSKRRLSRVSVTQKDQILSLWKQGYNSREIAEKTGVTSSTAHYHVDKFKKRGGLGKATNTIVARDMAVSPTTTTKRGPRGPYKAKTVTGVSQKAELLNTIIKLEAKVEVLTEMLKEERARNSRA